ncbi:MULTISPECIES: hypothetical protein [unclassified Bradyrhizobium]|uniref:hypothetical protein n=1 Tax=unclassified Bradyrhizobium TaxID=2631580 RepID=UPI001BAC229F|nr:MULTISPECIES: hypothetical protein [unclassified Bradyrhizobium]MBR1206597.1 hypothetical protein [Bradyrhizobium sp. AUGA SZCCT0124]MBR1315425.1 hypothetical protein [Bradyrhizobium sp. AUGA SZCCT0051]MBR1338513.1 hypothetical protein [Bradyrhizobium sp. AUGA SZCCT0105]MBR1356168.1 hypothetical protein [Bradyrhizobium sp. AUGA SZCCT0045]
MSAPVFVRCKDDTLAREILTVGRVYEVAGERDGNYRVLGRWLAVRRFEPATYDDWVAQR